MFVLLLTGITVTGPHAREIETAWQRLPARGKSLTVRVEMVPGRKLKGNWGYFQAGLIQLRDDLTAKDTLETFRHEWAHALYWSALTEQERSRWIRFYRGNRDRMPTENARRSAAEAFADCFMCVHSGRPVDGKVRAQVQRFTKSVTRNRGPPVGTPVRFRVQDPCPR